MLPTAQRLILQQYPDFFAQAKKVRSAHFVVFFVPFVGASQAAVIVPAKKVPTAVGRNSAKRKIRSMLTQIIKNEKLAPMKLVVYLNRSIDSISSVKLYQELTKLLTSIHG